MFTPRPRRDQDDDPDGYKNRETLNRLPTEVLRGMGRTAFRDIVRLGRSRHEDEREEAKRVTNYAQRLQSIIQEREGQQPAYERLAEPSSSESSFVCPICQTKECRHNS